MPRRILDFCHQASHRIKISVGKTDDTESRELGARFFPTTTDLFGSVAQGRAAPFAVQIDSDSRIYG
jgi:hypothetical protein